MTANQIRYAQHKETERHNKVSEVHEHRAVGAQERTAAAKEESNRISEIGLSETQRHNKETERQNWWSTTAGLAETIQHNRNVEGIQQFSASTNALKSERDYELGKRTATVAERNASVNERNATTQSRQADAAMVSAVASQQRAAAAQTSAQASVMQAEESRRHNVQVETETQRSNKVGEAIRRFGNTLESRKQTETQRHNMVSENQKNQEIVINRDDKNSQNLFRFIQTVPKAAVTFGAYGGM